MTATETKSAAVHVIIRDSLPRVSAVGGGGGARRGGPRDVSIRDDPPCCFPADPSQEVPFRTQHLLRVVLTIYEVLLTRLRFRPHTSLALARQAASRRLMVRARGDVKVAASP